MASKKDYAIVRGVCDNDLVNLILAIIPFTAWILGFITRFMEGKIVAGIIRVIPFCGLLIWILDLVFMITKGKIWRLLNI